MGLLQQGRVVLHGGATSDFKIDADALTDADLATAALLLKRRLPLFSRAEGVPRAGLRLAAALEPYATGSEMDPLLVVDDIYTTGSSVEAQRDGRWAVGAVLFARTPVTHRWILPLFTLSGALEWPAIGDVRR